MPCLYHLQWFETSPYAPYVPYILGAVRPSCDAKLKIRPTKLTLLLRFSSASLLWRRASGVSVGSTGSLFSIVC